MIVNSTICSLIVPPPLRHPACYFTIIRWRFMFQFGLNWMLEGRRNRLLLQPQRWVLLVIFAWSNVSFKRSQITAVNALYGINGNFIVK